MTKDLKCVLIEMLCDNNEKLIPIAIEMAYSENLSLNDMRDFLIDYSDSNDVGFSFTILNGVVTANKGHESVYTDSYYNNYFKRLGEKETNYITDNGFSVTDVKRVVSKWREEELKNTLIYVDFCENAYGIKLIHNIEDFVNFVCHIVGQFTLDYNIKNDNRLDIDIMEMFNKFCDKCENQYSCDNMGEYDVCMAENYKHFSPRDKD